MTSTIIPCLSYDDADAMIAWLCDNLGFAAKEVHHDDAGKVVHAEITFGDGMIMLGSRGVGQLDALLANHPGGPTQAIYVVSEDVDAIHVRVAAAGAEILLPLEDKDYGGRDFTFRDPEGHIWSVGSYSPWR
ncbi:MAG: glyoxalase [Salinarimonadaceae bacterium]|nr:MAG: glyoxalase [Salinarimonadaceae bacterium]